MTDEQKSEVEEFTKALQALHDSLGKLDKE
jgi:hypothetical protein